jgi:hypothetical protein
MAMLALAVVYFISFLVFSPPLFKAGARHFERGWLSKNRVGLTSFLFDALIGAAFNLWLAALIISYLDFEDLGIYRSLTTYFGVASLLANYAKSGFTANFIAKNRPIKMLQILSVAMILAPALQAAILLLAQQWSPSFGALSAATPVVVLLAMSARIIATLSSLTVVVLRHNPREYWRLALTRMLSLAPGSLFAIVALESLGIQGAFLVELINYSLMVALPLIIHKARKNP